MLAHLKMLLFPIFPNALPMAGRCIGKPPAAVTNEGGGCVGRLVLASSNPTKSSNNGGEKSEKGEREVGLSSVTAVILHVFLALVNSIEQEL